MAQLQTYYKQPHSRGGRVSSEAYRRSVEFCDDFTGLEEGADRYALLLLVKKVGKLAGFTPRMIHLLDYYMAFTRDVDWEQGARPIVYQSQSRTALDMGVSERQIQKLEKALFEAGAITWNDSGNHKRYGQRHPKSGRLIYAYGVELTPLAALATELEEKLQEKVLRDAAWMETKRQISWYRSQILGILREGQEEERDCQELLAFQKRYDSISIQIRTSLDLSALRDLWNRHKSLYSELAAFLDARSCENDNACLEASIAKKTPKGSSKGEQKFVHYKSTTQKPFNKLNTSSPSDNCFQGCVVEASQANQIPETGVQHVKIGVAVNAASQRFRGHLPLEPQWRDIVEAAAKIRVELDISQKSWGDACQLLGRNGAALCVLVTDQGSLRTDNRVRQPSAYFRGMLNKAKLGKLQLHRSVFGCVSKHNESLRADQVKGPMD